MSKEITKSDKEILKWVIWKMQQELDYQQGIVNGSASHLKKGIAEEVISRLNMPLDNFKDLLAGKFERPTYGQPLVYAQSEYIVCGVYGCKNTKPKSYQFCASCQRDYSEDPEAYK